MNREDCLKIKLKHLRGALGEYLEGLVLEVNEQDDTVVLDSSVLDSEVKECMEKTLQEIEEIEKELKNNELE